MVNGLYTSAGSMASQDFTIEAIAGNLANINTPGYKRDIPAFESILIDQLDAMFDIDYTGTEAPIFIQPVVAVDLKNGSLHQTGNKFDMAISGPGFFVVDTPEGEAYTRNGTFTINSEGELITNNGYKVLGESGAISIGNDSTELVVTKEGEIMVDGEAVGRFRIVDIPANDIRKIGNSLVLSAGNPTASEWSETTIQQGCLEESNVDSVLEMASLVSAMRLYEANQKIIQAQDETLGLAVNKLAQV